jgi:hypothetical protein
MQKVYTAHIKRSMHAQSQIVEKALKSSSRVMALKSRYNSLQRTLLSKHSIMSCLLGFKKRQSKQLLKLLPIGRWRRV